MLELAFTLYERGNHHAGRQCLSNWVRRDIPEPWERVNSE